MNSDNLISLMTSPNDFLINNENKSKNLDILLTLDDSEHVNKSLDNIFQSQEDINLNINSIGNNLLSDSLEYKDEIISFLQSNKNIELKNNFKEEMCSDNNSDTESIVKHSLKTTYKNEYTNKDISQISDITISLNSTPFNNFISQPNNTLNIFSFNETNVSFIPESIFTFHKRIKESLSDWSFIFALAAQIGSNLTPLNSFVNLKISLLLSIVSIQNNKKIPPLPIVAIGNDTSTINIIMNYLGNLAQRLITPLDEFHGGCFLIKDSIIEAGPIVLASDGVCYIGDFKRIKENSVRKLFKNIESGRVLLDKSTVTVPLECSIWTYWKCDKMQSKNINLLNTFMNVFGVPIIIFDELYNEDIINFLLSQATECSNNLFINSSETFTNEDLKRYLEIVSNKKVTVSAEASELLRSYFIVTRIEKPESLTQRAFISLELMAESFAKLSFRENVLKCDAIAAIYITENFVKFAYGTDTRSSPSYTSFNQIEEVEENMRKFECWCYEYISILKKD